MQTEPIDLNDSWLEQDALHAMNKFIQFSLATFTKATASSAIKKLQEEIDELIFEKDLNPCRSRTALLREYVDCIMCLLDSAARAGFTPSDVMQAFREKTLININRKWKENPDGTYSHVKHPSCENVPAPVGNVPCDQNWQNIHSSSQIMGTL